jgi:hypothetical protein
MYDAKIGRGIGQDPATFFGHAGAGNNRYTYVADGPTIFVDPAGLWKIKRNTRERQATATADKNTDTVETFSQPLEFAGASRITSSRPGGCTRRPVTPRLKDEEEHARAFDDGDLGLYVQLSGETGLHDRAPGRPTGTTTSRTEQARDSTGSIGGSRPSWVLGASPCRADTSSAP